MASVHDDSRVKKLIGSVDVTELAIEISAGQDMVRGVLSSVLQHLLRGLRAIRPSSGNRTAAEFKAALDEAAWGLDFSKLAADNHTTEDAVRHIVGRVAERARKVFTKEDTGLINDMPPPPPPPPPPKSMSIRSMVEPTPPSAHLGDVEWPASIPAHARKVRDSYAILFENKEAFRKDAVIVPLKDLETLREGIQLLDAKMVGVWTNLVGRMAPEEREYYTLEGWYEDTAIGKKDLVVRGAGSSLNIPPNDVDESSSELQVPHLKVMAGVAKPFVPKVTYQISPNGTMRRIVHDDAQDITSQAPENKHTITISPGQSPVKKKPKAQKPPGPPKAKKPHNPFMIWSMVERPRLVQEGPSILNSERSKNLGSGWHAMTAEERAPYEALFREEQERYKRQNEILKAGGTIDKATEKADMDALRAKAMAIPRVPRRAATPSPYVLRPPPRRSATASPSTMGPPSPPTLPTRSTSNPNNNSNFSSSSDLLSRVQKLNADMQAFARSSSSSEKSQDT